MKPPPRPARLVKRYALLIGVSAVVTLGALGLGRIRRRPDGNRVRPTDGEGHAARLDVDGRGGHHQARGETMRRFVTVATGFAAATVLMAVLGSGVAAAGIPDVTGQKYSDAQGALSDGGFTPVVATTIGDRVPWSDCVVTNAQERTVQPPPDSSGSSTDEALVSLDCDAPVATAETPGNSAASPAGRAAKAAAAEAAKRSDSEVTASG